ncbi:MAG: DUF3568 domain-containing protein [Deltaproteobacteria bacterium]|nr:DUF3568 domain-containing protein [Deltaproteobacteria bacterium]
MRYRIFQLLCLLLVSALLSGCAVIAALPFVSYLPVVGAGYQGYVVWKSGEATKYYAFDLDTTYQAVMRAAKQLKLEAEGTKSVSREEYTIETKGNVPMHIEISPYEKGVTAVVITISTFGDKNYVELFYRLVDENLPRETAAGEKKAQ